MKQSIIIAYACEANFTLSRCITLIINFPHHELCKTSLQHRRQTMLQLFQLHPGPKIVSTIHIKNHCGACTFYYKSKPTHRRGRKLPPKRVKLTPPTRHLLVGNDLHSRKMSMLRSDNTFCHPFSKLIGYLLTFVVHHAFYLLAILAQPRAEPENLTLNTSDRVLILLFPSP